MNGANWQPKSHRRGRHEVVCPTVGNERGGASKRHVGRYACIPLRAASDPLLSRGAYKVLIAIATHAGFGWSKVGRNTIAKFCDLHPNSVSQYVRELKTGGCLEACRSKKDRRCFDYRIIHDKEHDEHSQRHKPVRRYKKRSGGRERLMPNDIMISPRESVAAAVTQLREISSDRRNTEKTTRENIKSHECGKPISEHDEGDSARRRIIGGHANLIDARSRSSLGFRSLDPHCGLVGRDRYWSERLSATKGDKSTYLAVLTEMEAERKHD